MVQTRKRTRKCHDGLSVFDVFASSFKWYNFTNQGIQKGKSRIMCYGNSKSCTTLFCAQLHLKGLSLAGPRIMLVFRTHYAWRNPCATLFYTLLRCYKVGTGHGKHGKSWNLRISFSRPGKSWNLIFCPWRPWKIEVLFGRLVATDINQR